jgi:hypothetical protein
MRIIPLIIALLLASPALGQSRVYTNADLGRPMSRTSTVTAAEAAAILAPHAYVAPPDIPLDGPQSYVTPYDTSWPFDGPLPATRPLAPPWSSTTYVGRQHYSWRDSNGERRTGGLPSYSPASRSRQHH